MYATTIIPRPAKEPTREERIARLTTERKKTLALMQVARQQREYWTGVSATETSYWHTRERSLSMDLQGIDAELRWLATRDKERYAGEAEAARREDSECIGASDGATDWEKL